MAEKCKLRSRLGQGAIALALVGAMAAGGAGTAFADDSPFDTGLFPDTENVTATVSPATTDIAAGSNLLKTYGVRAGSAGPDMLGITNTNFDFTQGSASLRVQYRGWTSYAAGSDRLKGIAIWGSSVNEAPNPYYANLLSKILGGSVTTGLATTWMSNPSTGSWGDSNYDPSDPNPMTSVVDNLPTGTATIAGLEYYPDIIFGANKYSNWNLLSSGTNSGFYTTPVYTDSSATTISTSGSYAGSTIYNYITDASNNYQGGTPVFTNNDATNIWTQMRTISVLASTADGITDNSSKYTRYNNSDAEASALAYEKAIRGQMLYIASQIDAEAISQKTVAYLYAIDEEGTGYFFTPEASGLLVGDDTGKGVESLKIYDPDDPAGYVEVSNPDFTSAANPDDNYAANNSTINMGYMATLPFITTTFDSGVPFVSTTVYNDQTGADVTNLNINGMVMKVEDIYKANPMCVVTTASDPDNALAGVDVIIYNTSVETSMLDVKGGKNLSYVANATPLTNAVVSAWAANHGFDVNNKLLVAGDDFGTSSNQGYHGTPLNTDMSPNLYCERNYTCDKNTRAAWAFAKVYPELYYSSNDTYAYWVNKVYHVNDDDVAAVVAEMTNQNVTGIAFDADDVEDLIEGYAEAGYEWWYGSHNDDGWAAYAAYTGSSRASYYSGDVNSEETGVTGIFTPSQLWQSQNQS